MQGILVLLVLPELGGECVVVGVCKGIGGIVNQLAQGVIVIQAKLLTIFQPAGHGGHEPLGVFVIVSPEPLAAKGAFQVGGRIPIRFDAAKPEGKGVPLWNTGHIVIQQILGDDQMAFSAHFL